MLSNNHSCLEPPLMATVEPFIFVIYIPWRQLRPINANDIQTLNADRSRRRFAKSNVKMSPFRMEPTTFSHCHQNPHFTPPPVPEAPPASDRTSNKTTPGRTVQSINLSDLHALLALLYVNIATVNLHTYAKLSPNHLSTNFSPTPPALKPPRYIFYIDFKYIGVQVYHLLIDASMIPALADSY